jgi:transcriptional regulator with XRE-family HTH domain
VEDDAADAADSPKAPTAEDVAGRQLRMLRLGRGWTQQEVANRMRKLGYSWQQSTIGKIETAQRPLRLNELSDLAATLGVPVTHFLRPNPAANEGTDLDAVEREIRELLKARMDAAGLARGAENEYFRAGDRFHEASDVVNQMDSRLQTLKLWHRRYDEIAKASLEELAAATATEQAWAFARWWSPSESAALGWTPERERQMHLEALLKPYAELLREDQMDGIKEIFWNALDTAMNVVTAAVREGGR